VIENKVQITNMFSVYSDNTLPYCPVLYTVFIRVICLHHVQLPHLIYEEEIKDYFLHHVIASPFI
jgi:hypothetical protein